MKSARAKEMRMRQPPENSFVARTCISGEKPSPNRIRRAFASAADALDGLEFLADDPQSVRRLGLGGARERLELFR